MSHSAICNLDTKIPHRKCYTEYDSTCTYTVTNLMLPMTTVYALHIAIGTQDILERGVILLKRITINQNFLRTGAAPADRITSPPKTTDSPTNRP